jgi:hypothetical protein
MEDTTVPAGQVGDFKVGDVISFTRSHPDVPRELLNKYWRVAKIEGGDPSTGEVGAIGLDGPYDDPACTRRYQPKRFHGRMIHGGRLV